MTILKMLLGELANRFKKMTRKNIFLLLGGLLSVFTLLSCNRYIDSKSEKIKILDGSFTFYADSNVLVYKSDVGLKMDNVVIKPKPFQVDLPKKIRYYELAAPSDFLFYYDKGQVASIKIDLEEKRIVLPDTSYTPSSIELDSFIQQSPTENHKRYNIKEIPRRSERVNKVIRKGDATILLYNILKGNESVFEDNLNSFTFLNNNSGN